jgi:hypothetical protein
MAALHGTFGFDVFWRLTCGGKCTRQKRAAPCALSGTEGPLPCTVFAVLCARWGRSRDEKCTWRPLLWPGPSGIAHGGEGIGAQSVHGGRAVAKDKNVQGERIKRQEITCVCVLPISSSFFFTIPWDETQKESIWSMKQGEWVVLFLL